MSQHESTTSHESTSSQDRVKLKKFFGRIFFFYFSTTVPCLGSKVLVKGNVQLTVAVNSPIGKGMNIDCVKLRNMAVKTELRLFTITIKYATTNQCFFRALDNEVFSQIFGS